MCEPWSIPRKISSVQYWELGGCRLFGEYGVVDHTATTITHSTINTSQNGGIDNPWALIHANFSLKLRASPWVESLMVALRLRRGMNWTENSHPFYRKIQLWPCKITPGRAAQFGLNLASFQGVLTTMKKRIMRGTIVPLEYPFIHGWGFLKMKLRRRV
jgi:hypothetical protein